MSIPDHVLVVDDDPNIRNLLSSYLEKNGYRISLASDSTTFRDLMERNRIDLVILDLTFPEGEDGLVICRNLRAASDIPVIILSARVEEMDRIIGLEMGADDYVSKPFNPRELLARVKSVMRRSRMVMGEPKPGEERVIFHFAGWRLDYFARKLYNPEGGLAPLSGSEFTLLNVFLRHANRVLSREQLLEFSMGRNSDPFDRTIDMQVSRLRRRLRDDPRNPTIIKTVRSSGYLFCIKVEKRYDDEPTPNGPLIREM